MPIIFISIMFLALGFVVSDLLNVKDTKVFNDFCKLECKKYLIKKDIAD